MRIGTCTSTLAAITITLMVGLTGCQTDQAATQPTTMASPGAMSLCDGCGYEKGTDLCCAEGMVKCEGCGTGEGSPGCCK